MAKYESEHVHRVYDEIAQEFDDTRYKVWTGVQQFIDESFKDTDVKYVQVLEVGCGNGKNLEYIKKVDPNSHVEGCDMCQHFIDVCKSKKIDCCKADNLELTSVYFENSFDIVLSVAVIHHFSTIERRIKALEQLFAVLKPNGKLYIQVWAQEQPPDSKRNFDDSQEQLVGWGTSGEKRYYHVFMKDELYELFQKIESVYKGHVTDKGYDRGNWWMIVTKD